MVWKTPVNLGEVTRNVVRLVENANGCPALVSEDASLKTLAASRIARGANRFGYRDSTI